MAYKYSKKLLKQLEKSLEKLYKYDIINETVYHSGKNKISRIRLTQYKIKL